MTVFSVALMMVMMMNSSGECHTIQKSIQDGISGDNQTWLIKSVSPDNSSLTNDHLAEETMGENPEDDEIRNNASIKLVLQPNITTTVSDGTNISTNVSDATTLQAVLTSPKPVHPDTNPPARRPESVKLHGNVTADDVQFEFVSLEGRRYKGVVVHIGDGVPYNETLIENIKTLFNNSQALLKFATRHSKIKNEGLTFGSVIITVPSNWEKDFSAPPVSLGPPSIRVEPPSSSHGHVPYTLQPGGCGERGLYIHLTPEYVYNMFDPIVENRIGKAATVLVHEWAHLRWGVYDEYVTPVVLAVPHLSLARPFYLNDKGQVKPSACPLNITGWIVEEVNEEGSNASSPDSISTSQAMSSNIKEDERKAQAKEATISIRLCESYTPKGLPAPHCFFYSDRTQDTKGSLMMPLPASKRFCGDGVVHHDPAAPTPQNLRCGGRSVWEVMEEHDDFASHFSHHCERRPTTPMNGPISMTPHSEPKFMVYKRQNPKALLLILDCSHLPNDTLSSIKHDLIRFLETFVPKNTKVLALTSQSLVHVTDQPVDLQLAALTCDPRGTDNVSLVAADWLTRQSFSHSLVLTLQSSPDRRLLDQLSLCLPLNNTLHTVTIKQVCPEELLTTSGRRFACTEHRTGDDLVETLRGVLASHSAEEGLTQVYAQSHPLQPASVDRTGTMMVVSGNFFMNFCRGSSLLVVLVPTRILGRNPSPVDITLVHDGTDTPMSLYEHKLYNGTERVNIIIKIPCDSAHGDWEYVIRTPAETNSTVDVKVYQHEDEDTAVRISTFILVKKRLSMNCTMVEPTWSSNGSNSSSSNGSSSGRNNKNESTNATASTLSPSTNGSGTKDHDEQSKRPKDLGGRTISYSDSLARIVSVVTQGSKGEKTPVLGASVMAFVRNEASSNSFQVSLTDSGIGADEIADDGIYSGFLTGISDNGRYSVSVEATDAKFSRRRINTIRQKIFWDQHQQEKYSLRPSGTELYLIKVRCSGVRTDRTLPVKLQPTSSAEAAATLVDLEKEDHEGSSSGTMYSGTAGITHSGKLIVPSGCVLISFTGQGGGAPDSLALSGYRRSPDTSFAPVLPIVENPKQTFNSTSTSTFRRHFPALEQGQKNGSGDIAGGEEGIGKKRDIKEKEVLELTAETSKFRVKRAVEVLEVVEYTSRDILPPGRVRDLTVTKLHYMRPAVTLEWSSPGDDLYSGTAHRIDLRYHQHQEGLRVDFLRTTPVLEEKQVPPGALKPLPAGEKQSVVIFLKELSLEDLDEDYTLHFGLIVWDEADNAGSLSNLAEARFTVTEKQKELMDQASSRQLMNIAITLLAAALGVVLLLVCFAKIKAHLQKRKKGDCNDFAYSDITTYTKFGTNQRNRSRETSTKSGGASHGSSSENAKMKSKNGQSKPGKPDGVLQNTSMSEYSSQEPKGKETNYYGTK